jgi:hypothetical protein
MAWNGRFGDDEEGSGLELSLGLPGYFSASPTQATGAAAFLLLHVLLCLIRNEFHGMALASVNRPLFFLCSPGGFRFRGGSERRLCCCCCCSSEGKQWLRGQVTDEPFLLSLLSCFWLLLLSFPETESRIKDGWNPAPLFRLCLDGV